MTSEIVIVSTRPPKNPLSGGMAPAMREVAALYDHTTWYGLSVVQGKEIGEVNRYQVESIDAREICLSQELWNAHYRDFTNQTLWPEMHGIGRLAKEFAWADHRGYITVNEILAEQISKDLKGRPNTSIFIQDYHHLELARSLRKENVENPIAFFCHIPVPDPGTMTSDVRSFYADHVYGPLLHADAANFQTAQDARRFMKFLGIENPPVLGAYETQTLMCTNGHKLRVGHFPISINTPKVVTTAQQSQLSEKGQALADRIKARNVFINFERNDYTKDLETRLEAFRLLLERNPEMRGKVQLTAGAEPSRTDIQTYVDVAEHNRTLAETINTDFPDAWVDGEPPVLFLNENYPHSDVITLFRGNEHCRTIGCVTAEADGMNLVAKEYAAAQNPECAGPLILSRGAGAAHELGRSALLFEPRNVEQLYQQMLEAIRMDQREANRRNAEMRAHLETFDIKKWGAEHEELFRLVRDEQHRVLPVPARHEAAPPALKLMLAA